MSHVVITGVPVSAQGVQGGGPSPRLEINTIIKDDMQFSLYIQALQGLYATNQSDPTSHFSIGGIHGLPYQRWEGSGGTRSASSFGGYCTHGSVLFPTWHRPYVALFEQALQKQAVKVAAQYKENPAQWQAAAAKFRAPYWDWASNSVPPRQVISDRQVSIITPTSAGKKTAVDNPLLGYRFHPIDPSFPSPYSRWPTTLRHPKGTGANATSDVEEMIDWLAGDQHDIRDSTYNLLTRVTTWDAFSNHSPVGESGVNSIEAIHDGIHVNVGGSGHMADTSVAGFDSLFMLHHANVDRVFALWQALNPDVWVSEGRNTGTFTATSNSVQTTSTDLTPFWNNATNYWSSTAARTWTSFGYTYPEFVGLNMSNKNAVRAAIGAKINELYGDGSRNSFAFAAAGTGAVDANADTIANEAPANLSAPEVAQEIFSAPVAATPGVSAVSTPATETPPAKPAAPPAPAPAAAPKPPAPSPLAQPAPAPAPAAQVPINQAPPRPAGDHAPPPPPSAPSGDRIAVPSNTSSTHPAQQPTTNPASTQSGTAAVPSKATPATQSTAGTKPQAHLAQPGDHEFGRHEDHFDLLPDKSRQYHDWSARIRFNKNGLRSSFSVLIFIGHVPKDPRKWRSSSSYIGAHHAFANSEVEKCENCRDHEDDLVEGIVHLNHWLATFAGLNSFDPEVVEPYLQKNMTWRIHMVDGSDEALEKLPSLQVVVVDTPLGFKKGEMFPRCGKAIHHHGITENKTGGHHTKPKAEAH